MHRQSVAIFRSSTQCIDIGDVEFWVNTVREQVHCEIDDVDISRAFTISEERSFNTVSASHDPELCGGHRTTTIVMGMQADDDRLPIFDRAPKPFDDIAVHIWRIALDGRRQIENQRI